MTAVVRVGTRCAARPGRGRRRSTRCCATCGRRASPRSPSRSGSTSRAARSSRSCRARSGPIRWSRSCGPTRCSSASRGCCARSTTPRRASRASVWQWPGHEPVEVICHNDFCPYNLLFEGTELTGVIDFDLASPGPRAWDLGQTAYRFVPLTDPENPDTPRVRARRAGAPARALLRGLRRPRGGRHVRGRARPPARADRLHRRSAPPRATRPSRPCSPAATS